MERVTIFMRTALFTYSYEPRHVPVGVTVLEGDVPSQEGGALTVKVTRMLDDRGRVLSETPVTLIVPWSKIDHLLQRD
jgi:hypothetical protein